MSNFGPLYAGCGCHPPGWNPYQYVARSAYPNFQNYYPNYYFNSDNSAGAGYNSNNPNNPGYPDHKNVLEEDRWESLPGIPFESPIRLFRKQSIRSSSQLQIPHTPISYSAPAGIGAYPKFPVTSEQTIKANEGIFRLAQFHLHRPGENQIEGQSFAAEIHFVFQTENENLAVIGYCFRLASNPRARSDAMIRALLEEKTLQLPDQLSPYFNFSGSLTSPPYSISVLWFSAATPRNITQADLDALSERQWFQPARDLQERNYRVVAYCS
jgi:carbonic anhydrase